MRRARAGQRRSAGGLQRSRPPRRRARHDERRVGQRAGRAAAGVTPASASSGGARASVRRGAPTRPRSPRVAAPAPAREEPEQGVPPSSSLQWQRERGGGEAGPSSSREWQDGSGRRIEAVGATARDEAPGRRPPAPARRRRGVGSRSGEFAPRRPGSPFGQRPHGRQIGRARALPGPNDSDRRSRPASSSLRDW
jgi:hypothetical protein